MTSFWVFQHDARRVIHRAECHYLKLWRVRDVPGAKWLGPYTTYMEALKQLKETGYKKGAQLNCRYCSPQYTPRQWNAEP
jgi:hypothetical protein